MERYGQYRPTKQQKHQHSRSEYSRNICVLLIKGLSVVVRITRAAMGSKPSSAWSNSANATWYLSMCWGFFAQKKRKKLRGQTSVSQQELINRRIWLDLSRCLCQPFCSEHLLASRGPACAGVNSFAFSEVPKGHCSNQARLVESTVQGTGHSHAPNSLCCFSPFRAI